MEVSAKLNQLKMSPRKVRLVVDVVRGNQVAKALAELQFMKKHAAEPVAKLLKSAIANATNNFNLEINNLFVKTIFVDESTTMKRWMPKAHGRATKIRKRSCHINIVLGEIKDSGLVAPKKQDKIEAPIKLGAKPAEDTGVKVKGGTDKPEISDELLEEKGAHLPDAARSERGRSGHGKAEGGSTKRGFVGKMFNRKAG